MSTSRQVWVVCDECGLRSASSDENSLQARLAAIETGWVHAGLGIDYCPEHIPERKRPAPTRATSTEAEALW